MFAIFSYKNYFNDNCIFMAYQSFWTFNDIVNYLNYILRFKIFLFLKNESYGTIKSFAKHLIRLMRILWVLKQNRVATYLKYSGYVFRWNRCCSFSSWNNFLATHIFKGLYNTNKKMRLSINHVFHSCDCYKFWWCIGSLVV